MVRREGASFSAEDLRRSDSKLSFVLRAWGPQTPHLSMLGSRWYSVRISHRLARFRSG